MCTMDLSRLVADPDNGFLNLGCITHCQSGSIRVTQTMDTPSAERTRGAGHIGHLVTRLQKLSSGREPTSAPLGTLHPTPLTVDGPGPIRHTARQMFQPTTIIIID